MKHLGAPTAGATARLLSDSAKYSADDSYIFEEAFAAGKALPGKFTEALICQAYFNPYIIPLINSLLGGCPQSGDGEVAAQRRDSVLTLKFEELCQRGVIGQTDNVSRLTGKDLEEGCAVCSHAVQVPVPGSFQVNSRTPGYLAFMPTLFRQGNTYGDLFEFLVHEFNMLPLGLYRFGENKGNNLPYVFTNPSPESKVAKEKDLVFVLAPCVLAHGNL